MINWLPIGIIIGICLAKFAEKLNKDRVREEILKMTLRLLERDYVIVRKHTAIGGDNNGRA